jgi:GNAT superfamily N-acetyltransferase
MYDRKKEFKIKKGKEKDFSALLKLFHEEAIYDGSNVSVVKNSVKQMKKEKKHIHFFVAERNNKVIGAAVYSIIYYTWAGKSIFLDDLYVKSEFRSNGIGSELLNKVFEVAEKEKCNRLSWQVEEKNIGAQKFYKKIGARFGDKWFNCDFDQKAIIFFLKNQK